MNIVVFGANGRTGKLIVIKALNEGHNVTAFVRNKEDLDLQMEKLKIIEGDVMNYCKVESAIEGKDTVILALINKNKAVLGNYLLTGTKNIIRAMNEQKVKRLICISASGVLGNEGGFILDKILIPLFYRNLYKEMKTQLRLILQSELDWIVIRPSLLTDTPKNPNYHISFDKPYRHRVSRSNLADFVIKQIFQNEYIHRMPIISN
jgi:biliverdin reductase / flavin reductase